MIGEQQIIPYYSPITSKGGKGKKRKTKRYKKTFKYRSNKSRPQRRY